MKPELPVFNNDNSFLDNDFKLAEQINITEEEDLDELNFQ